MTTSAIINAPAGPRGPAGAVGPDGPQGPVGPAGSSTPGNPVNAIQFNNGGALAGIPNFQYNSSSRDLSFFSMSVADGNPGNVTFQAATNTTEQLAGGSVNLLGADGYNGDGGAVNISGGWAWDGSNPIDDQHGGAVTITGGGGSLVSGGSVRITGGQGGTVNSGLRPFGGHVQITGGRGGSGTVGGGGAAVTLTGGEGGMQGGDGGALNVFGGSGGPNGAGGIIFIMGGQPGANGLAGDVDIRGGYAGADGHGGNIWLLASAATGTGNKYGGDVTIQSGTSTGTAEHGEIVLNSAGAFSVRTNSLERLRIRDSGAWSVGETQFDCGISGQVLKSQGENSPPVWANAAGGGLQNVVEDVTPELGGDLATLGNEIYSNADLKFKTASGTVAITQDAYMDPLIISTGMSTTVFDNSMSEFKFDNVNSSSSPITLTVDSTMKLSSGDGVYTLMLAPYSQPSTLQCDKLIISSLTDDMHLKSLTGLFSFRGNVSGSAGTKLELYESGTNSHVHYIGLKAPDSVISTRVWTLPQDNPATSSGKFITTDGTGILSFASPFTNGNFSAAGGITGTINAGTVNIDSFDINTYRSAKYTIQATQGAQYQISEVYVVHDGSSAFMTEVGKTFTGGAAIATFSVGVSASNLLLNATVTATTSFKIERVVVTI